METANSPSPSDSPSGLLLALALVTIALVIVFSIGPFARLTHYLHSFSVVTGDRAAVTALAAVSIFDEFVIVVIGFLAAIQTIRRKEMGRRLLILFFAFLPVASVVELYCAAAPWESDIDQTVSIGKVLLSAPTAYAWIKIFKWDSMKRALSRS